MVDPQGASVALAEITVSKPGTDGAPAESETDGTGVFHVPLELGQSYALSVRAEGFAQFSETIIGGETVAPIRLKVESVAEAVTVEATGSTAIDPQETQGGLTLSESQVASVPLNGRSFTDLLAISSGVVPVSSAQPNAVVMSGVASTPPSGDLDIGALSVSGQRETANAFRVNGANVQEDVNMGVAIVPTLDSIAGLKVLTDSFDAKLGTRAAARFR